MTHFLVSSGLTCLLFTSYFRLGCISKNNSDGRRQPWQ